MIKFSDLTKEEIASVTNGCGTKSSFVKVPNFLFKASCIKHDFYYYRGHTEKDRKKADKSFYKYMKIDIKERTYGFFKKIWYYSWAWSYYRAVRLFGKKAFYYSDTMRTL